MEFLLISTPSTDSPSWSSGHGTACTVAASCSDPKTASGHLDAVSHDRPPSLSHTGLPAGTAHTTDVLSGMLYSSFSIVNHTRVRWLTRSPPGAAAYGLRSISSRQGLGQHAPDARKGFSVWSALLPLMKRALLFPAEPPFVFMLFSWLANRRYLGI